jgi:hypothetical protein
MMVECHQPANCPLSWLGQPLVGVSALTSGVCMQLDNIIVCYSGAIVKRQVLGGQTRQSRLNRVGQGGRPSVSHNTATDAPARRKSAQGITWAMVSLTPIQSESSRS